MPTRLRIDSQATLDGRSLTPDQVARVARGLTGLSVSPAGISRVKRAHQAALEISQRRSVYGQTTGVGSKRTVKVSPSRTKSHILNLLRSHAATAGPKVEADKIRAMLVVRLNQLLVGGSGVSPSVVKKLHQALAAGLTPPIYRYYSLGTGDLGALAVTALCINGELPWEGGSLEAVQFQRTDPMAFISSSALTQGEAALAYVDLQRLLNAGLLVAALSFIAMGGSPEVLSEEVMAAKPHESQRDVATRLRSLLEGQPLYRSGRVQDPYSLRAMPQVHGSASDSSRHLLHVLKIEMNSASENPLISAASHDVFHNGNFHTAFLALALDNVRAAIYQTAALSSARTSDLMDPSISGYQKHLASNAGSSYGLHILEYVSNSALADVRRLVVPASLGSAVFDARAEEHASFAPQAAWSTSEIVPPFETILACELITATRAIQQKDMMLSSTASGLAQLFQKSRAAFGDDFSDKYLDPLLVSAVNILRSLPVDS